MRLWTVTRWCCLFVIRQKPIVCSVFKLVTLTKDLLDGSIVCVWFWFGWWLDRRGCRKISCGSRRNRSLNKRHFEEVGNVYDYHQLWLVTWSTYTVQFCRKCDSEFVLIQFLSWRLAVNFGDISSNHFISCYLFFLNIKKKYLLYFLRFYSCFYCAHL